VTLDQQTADLVNSTVFGSFVTLVVIASVATLARVVGFLRRREHIPLILKRDAVLMGGLAWPFALIFGARATGLSLTANPPLMQSLAWIVVTSVPPIAGMAFYVYVEVFKIGQPPRPTA
jgi:hypothetical protein